MTAQTVAFQMAFVSRSKTFFSSSGSDPKQGASTRQGLVSGRPLVVHGDADADRTSSSTSKQCPRSDLRPANPKWFPGFRNAGQSAWGKSLEPISMQISMASRWVSVTWVLRNGPSLKRVFLTCRFNYRLTRSWGQNPVQAPRSWRPVRLPQSAKVAQRVLRSRIQPTAKRGQDLCTPQARRGQAQTPLHLRNDQPPAFS